MLATAANVHNATQAHKLLHGKEPDVYTEAGYQGVKKQVDTQGMEVNWYVVMRPGKRRVMNKSNKLGAFTSRIEEFKFSIWVKVEYPFRIIKCQFGYTKVRCHGLTKNAALRFTLFMLSNCGWCVRTFLLDWQHEYA